MLVVYAGCNDLADGRSVEQTLLEYQRLLVAAGRFGCKVLVCGLIPRDDGWYGVYG